MPKNQFQRPAPVLRNHNVPRHGTPLPVRKAEAPRLAPPKADTQPLPTLADLLAKPQQP